MAEAWLDLRGRPKDAAYAELHGMLEATLKDLRDEVAAMATFSSLVHHAFGHLWTGFYRVVEPNLLRVGPYQGTVGCLEIRFGRGVCGTAAGTKQTVVVPDVNVFPGHISCDGRSRSEIVVPMFDARGEVRAVLDIDSAELARFDELDVRWLERAVRLLP